MGCCGGRNKVYAEQAAEARVPSAMVARRELNASELRAQRCCGGGTAARHHSVQGPLTNGGRRSSVGGEPRRLSDAKSATAASGRRGSLANQSKAPVRRGSVGNSAVLTTDGATAARRKGGQDSREPGGRRGSARAKPSALSAETFPKDRHRRHSVESRSPLSPATESPAGSRGLALSLPGPEEEEDEPLIARTQLVRKAGGLARARSGSQPHALSPTMRGGLSPPSKGTTTMEMLLMMDNVSIVDLHKAGTTLGDQNAGWENRAGVLSACDKGCDFTAVFVLFSRAEYCFHCCIHCCFQGATRSTADGLPNLSE